MRNHRTRLHRPVADTASAPAWVVTYADLVTLLLCLFAALLSMSTFKQERFQSALDSLQGAFGSKESLGASQAPDPSLFGKLQYAFQNELADSTTSGESDAALPWFSISRTQTGARLVLAGPSVIVRGQPQLTPLAKQALSHLASELAGRNCAITIRGHSAKEPAAEGSDSRDLSYQRAAQAAQWLEQGGVPAQVIQVVALGESRPAYHHAYTEKRRAMNRRVEIEITEGGEPQQAAE